MDETKTREALDEKAQLALMEVEAYREAFRQNPRNQTHLTKQEKAQLERYDRGAVTRAEFNQTIYGMGQDFGRLIITSTALEMYARDVMGDEKYEEYREKAKQSLFPTLAEPEEDINPPTSDAQEGTSNPSSTIGINEHN